jgi:hypothetical protein
MVSYKAEIRPLFRQSDVDAMKPRGLDLSSYGDVYAKANAILGALVDQSMPCDAPWPQPWIDKFQQWISDGKLP